MDDSLFMVALFICKSFMFDPCIACSCFVISSYAIIQLGMRELFNDFYCFLDVMTCSCYYSLPFNHRAVDHLWCVVVAFPGHTLLLYEDISAWLGVFHANQTSMCLDSHLN